MKAKITIFPVTGEPKTCEADVSGALEILASVDSMDRGDLAGKPDRADDVPTLAVEFDLGRGQAIVYLEALKPEGFNIDLQVMHPKGISSSLELFKSAPSPTPTVDVVSLIRACFDLPRAELFGWAKEQSFLAQDQGTESGASPMTSSTPLRPPAKAPANVFYQVVNARFAAVWRIVWGSSITAVVLWFLFKYFGDDRQFVYIFTIFFGGAAAFYIGSALRYAFRGGVWWVTMDDRLLSVGFPVCDKPSFELPLDGIAEVVETLSGPRGDVLERAEVSLVLDDEDKTCRALPTPDEFRYKGFVSALRTARPQIHLRIIDNRRMDRD